VDVLALFRLKKGLLIALVVIVAVTILFVTVSDRRAYSRALHQDRHAHDWAMDFASPPDNETRERAAEALQALGSNAVPALVDLLHTHARLYERPLGETVRRVPMSMRTNLLAHVSLGTSGGKRYAAATALGFLGTSASGAIPDLLDALDDPVGHVGWAAAAALGNIGSNAVPALMRLATNPDWQLTHKAVYALGVAGTNAAEATPVLLNALRSTNESARSSTRYSLSMIGTLALPAICDTLRKDDPAMREQLSRLFSPVHSPNSGFLSTLNQWTRDASPVVRLQAMEALGNLRLTNSIPILKRLLNDPDESVRIAATNALDQVNGVVPASAPK